MSKRVGNIYLVWRKGSGHKRILVGELKTNSSEGTRFKYLSRHLDEAKRQGFTPYPGFPDVSKTYDKNVLETFAQRLIKSERNDVNDFYTFWRVDPMRKHDAYYMLAQTQGLLPIDNFEFLADFNPSEKLTFVSEIAGLSIFKPSVDAISIGDDLIYQIDPENTEDEHAVKLFKGSLHLGYVKIIHSRIFHKSSRRMQIKVHHIEKNGALKRVFILVSVF